MNPAEIVHTTRETFDAENFYAYPVDRPWLRTDFVASLDGAAWSGEGTSAGFGSAVDKWAFRTMRSLADVVIVGAGTARDEGYRPITESSIDSAPRQRHGFSAPPVLAVVSRSMNVPPDLINGGAVVITYAGAPTQALADAKSTTEVIAHGQDDIDWQAVFAEFRDRGWQRMLCEGGPSLHGHLLEAGFVDEICLTIAPKVAGGDAGRIATSDSTIDIPAALAGVAVIDGVLLTRWRPGPISAKQ